MSRGRYGNHGGQYVSETLMNELIRLEESYEHYKKDREFVGGTNDKGSGWSKDISKA